MKKLILNFVAFLNNAKVHTNHSAIKGRKSGGSRDNNGQDWKTVKPDRDDEN
jgi:hypothetical protein